LSTFEKYSYFVCHYYDGNAGEQDEEITCKLDTEGCVVENSPFTTFALTKNYEVNIHEDKDDDDVCFILWL